jgi:hypothetical protein
MPSYLMESMSDLLSVLTKDQNMDAKKVITVALLVNLITN